jgi:Branched-chain amino acid ABC-type transport system, permease components
MRSLHGVVIAGFLLALIENLFGFYVSVEFKSIVAFLLIVIILYVKPAGLFDHHYVRKV